MFDDYTMPSRDKKNAKPFKIPKQREETTAVCLKELNLDTELLTQYKNAKDLLHEAMDDEEIPLNQKAQIINSITNIIKQILELQEALHNVENMKILESTLVETLKIYPELAAKFLTDYEKALSNVS